MMFHEFSGREGYDTEEPPTAGIQQQQQDDKQQQLQEGDEKSEVEKDNTMDEAQKKKRQQTILEMRRHVVQAALVGGGDKKKKVPNAEKEYFLGTEGLELGAKFAGGGRSSTRGDGADGSLHPYIADCFLLPRSGKHVPPEKQGSPWLDDALYLFAQSRGGTDYESAAKRFFKFNSVAKEIGMTDLDGLDGEAQKALALGCWYLAPEPDALGRPICYVFCRFADWSKLTVKQFQRASLWMLWRLGVTFNPIPQTEGITFAMSFKDFSMFQCKMEFENWITYVMQSMLPTKIGAIFIAHEPFWFSSMMYPWVKSAIKPKMQERIMWLGSKEEKIRQNFLEKAFTPGKSDGDKTVVAGTATTSTTAGGGSASCSSFLDKIPTEFGGKLVFKPQDYGSFLSSNYGTERICES